MKKLFWLLLLLPALAQGQIILKTPGLPVVTAQPTAAPSRQGAEYVVDTFNRVHQYDRSSDLWVFTGWSLQRITGCVSPAYTPGYMRSPFVVNTCTKPQLFLYNGSTWDCLNCESSISTNATLTGDGTVGSPLSIARQGAATGEVLKWSGTTWLPAADLGTTYTGGTGIGVIGTVISNLGDLSSTNELQTLSVSANAITLSASGGSATIAGAGGNTVTTSGSTITITGTPATGAETIVTGGTGIGVTGAGTSGSPYVIANSGDLSATNELQSLTSSGTTSFTSTLSNSGGSWTAAAGTGVGISRSGDTFTISNTGDLSSSNELQTISVLTNVITLSNSGGSVTFTGAGGNTVSTSGSTITITGTVPTGAETIVNQGTGITVTGIGTSGSPYVVINTGDTNAGDDITGTLAAGQLPYATAAQTVAGSNNLFWNNTNIRLGIGTNTPAALLDATSTGLGEIARFTNAGGNISLGGVGGNMNITTAGRIYRSGGTLDLSVDAGQAVRFMNFNTEVARMSNTGLLGFGTTSPSSVVDIVTNSLGITQTNASGLSLRTTTAAALGAQQMSPGLLWEGLGWGITASTSQTVRFRADVLPVQGTVPTGTWQLASSINAGAYTNIITANSSGDVLMGLFTKTSGNGGNPKLTSGSGSVLILDGNIGTNIGWDANINGTHSVSIGNRLTRTNIVGFYNGANTLVADISNTGAFEQTPLSSSASSGTVSYILQTSTFAAASGSALFRPVNINYTINNVGTAVTGVATGFFLNATETALNGMGHLLMDLQVGGVSKLSVSRIGDITIPQGGGLIVNPSYATKIFSSGIHNMTFQGAGGIGGYFEFRGNGGSNLYATVRQTSLDFGLITTIKFGTTSAAAAIKGNGTTAAFRLGDDSADAPISSGPVTSSGYIQFGSYTTTQRDALTAVNGMVIYNSTLARFQGYAGGAWVDLN